MAAAASAFLEALDDAQLAVAAKAFDDTVERETWFYTPTNHGGLPLSSMTSSQQQRAMQLVASGTSEAGYVTVSTVIGLDNVLDRVEGWWARWGRERGRDPGLYYVAIFGDPTGSGPWAWRFGGHHVSLNLTIADGEVAGSTPNFLGADPAGAPLLGGHLLRPLGAAEDLGRELVRSLSDEQRTAAILSPVAPADLVSANRPRYGLGDGDLALPLIDVWRGRFEGELGALVEKVQADAEARAGITPEAADAVRLTREPRGTAVAGFTGAQRELLRTLLDLYVGRVPEELAAVEAAKYSADADLDRLIFSWAGSLEPAEGHYYRIQGPELLCEYDNTQRGANHVHTVWRDPRRDFGADPLAEHYRHSH